MATPVKPYVDDPLGKKEQVARMFNNIAGRYDFLNHFFSLGIDLLWRKRALRFLRNDNPRNILDVATGTGDFAIQAARSSLKPASVIGVDISEGMLQEGRHKIARKGLEKVIDLRYGDSENLPFGDACFDAVTVAFGVRNFENLDSGLREMHRVLKSGGKIVILEFSKPRHFPMKQAFGFYFHRLMPSIGKLISSDREAYAYLPKSVAAFPEGMEFMDILERIGFREVRIHRLTGGIAAIYSGVK